jgi:hypothetical protein
MEAHALLKAYALGVGVSILGNVNPEKSYFGATLSLYLGYMPPW